MVGYPSYYRVTAETGAGTLSEDANGQWTVVCNVDGRTADIGTVVAAGQDPSDACSQSSDSPACPCSGITVPCYVIDASGSGSTTYSPAPGEHETDTVSVSGSELTLDELLTGGPTFAGPGCHVTETAARCRDRTCL